MSHTANRVLGTSPPACHVSIFKTLQCAAAMMGLAAVLLASPAIAAEVHDMDCAAPMNAYPAKLEDGIDASQPSEEKIVMMTDRFREMVRASQLSIICYQQAWSRASEDEQVVIRAEMTDVANTLKRSSEAFERSLDAIAGDVLADVAPAAGAGAITAPEAAARNLAGMEMLFDSYMALEKASALFRRLDEPGLPNG